MINVTLRPNPVKPLESKGQYGIITFISWERLDQELRMSGIIKKNERAEGFEIDTDGIKVIIDRV